LPSCDPIPPLRSQRVAVDSMISMSRMCRQAVGSGRSVPLVTKMGVRGLCELVAACSGVHHCAVAAPRAVVPEANVQASSVLSKGHISVVYLSQVFHVRYGLDPKKTVFRNRQNQRKPKDLTRLQLEPRVFRIFLRVPPTVR
jgi:hypothetical protein